MANALFKSEFGHTILLNNYNARLCKLTPIIPENERYNEDNELTSVDYGDFKFEIGQEILTDKFRIKIQKIKKLENGNYGPGYYLQSHILNYSSSFIAPMLGYSRKYFRWDNEFCNCFVGTEFNGDYGNSIYLLYRFSGSQEFQNMESALMLHENYEGMVEVDSCHTLYEFSIPEKYERDYYLILEGKYSKISDEFKKQILLFHGEKSQSPLHEILYKSPNRKKSLEKKLSNKNSEIIIPEDMDLLDTFYEDKEIYLNKYQFNESRNRIEQSPC